MHGGHGRLDYYAFIEIARPKVFVLSHVLTYFRKWTRVQDVAPKIENVALSSIAACLLAHNAAQRY